MNKTINILILAILTTILTTTATTINTQKSSLIGEVLQTDPQFNGTLELKNNQYYYTIKYNEYTNKTNTLNKITNDYPEGVPLWEESKTTTTCTKTTITAQGEECTEQTRDYTTATKLSITKQIDTASIHIPGIGTWHIGNESTIIRITNNSIGVNNNTVSNFGVALKPKIDGLIRYLNFDTDANNSLPILDLALGKNPNSTAFTNGNHIDSDNCYRGKCWQQDGTDANQNTINLGSYLSSPDLNFSRTNAFGIFMRINALSNTSSMQWYGGSNSNYELGFQWKISGVYCYLNNNVSRSITNYSLAINESAFVGCMYNGSHLFLIKNTNISIIISSMSIFGSQVTYIGSLDPQINYWNGSIDEVMIFNRSLTSAEITNLYYGNYSMGYVNGTHVGQVFNLTAHPRADGDTINVSVNASMPTGTKINVSIRFFNYSFYDQILAFFDFKGDDYNSCNNILLNDNKRFAADSSYNISNFGLYSGFYAYAYLSNSYLFCKPQAPTKNYADNTLFLKIRFHNLVSNRAEEFFWSGDYNKGIHLAKQNTGGNVFLYNAYGLSDNSIVSNAISNLEVTVAAWFNLSHICISLNNTDIKCENSTGSILNTTLNNMYLNGWPYAGSNTFNSTMLYFIWINKSLSWEEIQDYRSKLDSFNTSNINVLCDVSVNQSGCGFGRVGNFSQVKFDLITNTDNATPVMYDYTIGLTNASSALPPGQCDSNDDCTLIQTCSKCNLTTQVCINSTIDEDYNNECTNTSCYTGNCDGEGECNIHENGEKGNCILCYGCDGESEFCQAVPALADTYNECNATGCGTGLCTDAHVCGIYTDNSVGNPESPCTKCTCCGSGNDDEQCDLDLGDVCGWCNPSQYNCTGNQGEYYSFNKYIDYDGNCGADYECSGTIENVSQGNVCRNETGFNIAPLPQSYACIWDECISGNQTARIFLTGFKGDGSTNCDSKQWWNNGTSTNYAPDYINLTANQTQGTCDNGPLITYNNTPQQNSNLSMNIATTTSINLTWKYNSQTNGGTQIYVNGTYNHSITYPQNSTNLTDLCPNCSYSITAYAYNNSGANRTIQTNNVTMWTLANPPPTNNTPQQASNLTLNIATNTSLNMTWKYNSQTNGGVQVYVNGTYNHSITYPQNSTNLTMLCANCTYFITIYAYNESGANRTIQTNNRTNTTLPNYPIITDYPDLVNRTGLKTNNCTWAVINYSQTTDHNINTIYKIYANNINVKNESFNTNQTNITGLTEQTNYNITIYTWNSTQGQNNTIITTRNYYNLTTTSCPLGTGLPWFGTETHYLATYTPNPVTLCIHAYDNTAIHTVQLQINGSNHTTTNTTEGYCNSTTYAAINHTFQWWANDTSGNTNQTRWLWLNISKATPTLTLTINTSKWTNPEGSLKVTGAGCPTELYINDTTNCTMNRSNTTLTTYIDIQTWTPTKINYTIRTTGNQNYTAYELKKELTIIDYAIYYINQYMEEIKMIAEILIIIAIILFGWLTERKNPLIAHILYFTAGGITLMIDSTNKVFVAAAIIIMIISIAKYLTTKG